MGNKLICELCNDEGDNYNNPLVKFYHLGKYHNRVWCISCLTSKMIISNENSLYPVIYLN